jgi:hypothetical protein
MHRDSIDRFEVHTVPSLVGRKRLGAYLLEAGLISEAQVEVALTDQQATGMKFGEVLSTRGWINQQTVEYLMKKVVIPERKAMERNTHPQSQKTHSQGNSAASSAARQASSRRSPSNQGANRSASPAPKRSPAPNPAAFHAQQKRTSAPASGRSPVSRSTSDDSLLDRRDAPISKPLPSVSNPNDDVSWVG